MAVSGPQRATPTANSALWAMLAGNFVIGSGVLAPAAMINDLAAAFTLGPETIGLLVTWGAIVLCIGAPVLAWATSAVPRRVLLVGCLALYAAGHGASALAGDFAGLMAARLAMIAAAAVFTPQAAASVGMLVPPERRAGAVTAVFMGWSLAAAFGVPMLGLTAAAAGWQASYGLLAALSALAGVWVWSSLPAGLRTPPVPLSAWARVARTPSILAILAVTFLTLTGAFVLFPYLGAELKRQLGLGPGEVAAYLGLYGLTGAIGGFAMARLVARTGAPNGSLIALGSSALGLLLWAALPHTPITAALAVAVWGSGFAAGNSMQQSRLIAADPALAPASVALNTSVLYMGQAVGASLGGALIAAQAHSAMGWTALAVIALAITASWATQRRFAA